MILHFVTEISQGNINFHIGRTRNAEEKYIKNNLFETQEF